MRTTLKSPEILPVLSRGKHRNPRRGACFMEYASYLAGESWSDHPVCTDPALASLARMVNDCTSDAARGRLVTLIPAVIGLLGDGRRTGIRLAALAASAALPVASESRQRALAAGILRCDELLAGFDDEWAAEIRETVRDALLRTPAASRWARDFLEITGPLNPRAIPLMSDAIIRTAVVGIAEACVDDPDDRLRSLLAGAIESCSIDASAIEARAIDAHANAEEQLAAPERTLSARELQPTR